MKMNKNETWHNSGTDIEIRTLSRFQKNYNMYCMYMYSLECLPTRALIRLHILHVGLGLLIDYKYKYKYMYMYMHMYCTMYMYITA